LRHSKPGNIPNYIAALVIMAHRMEGLFESGAGATYPEFFTPLEWEAFLTLKYARAKDDEKRMPAKPQGSAQAQLEARMMPRIMTK
jgi:hypothetical protein